jgi:hypothetical protein
MLLGEPSLPGLSRVSREGRIRAGVTVRPMAVSSEYRQPVSIQIADCRLAGAAGAISVKLHDKITALEKLGRSLGMFKDGARALTLPAPERAASVPKSVACASVGRRS